MRQMTSAIGDLWRGEMPLSQVFWSFTIVFGTLFNFLATGVGLVAMAGGMPAPAAVALHFLPLPYNFLVLVGVWRSAKSFRATRSLPPSPGLPRRPGLPS